MQHYTYLYGPIPSRRLGKSLGISPTRDKRCNYNCIYCQIGRTKTQTNTRFTTPDLADILKEVDAFLKTGETFDCISVVGNGEPTLYAPLGALIKALKSRTTKPVALITNGALFERDALRKEAMLADIVLPSLNGYDEASHQQINRPLAGCTFEKVLKGLTVFTHHYPGKTWLEIMVMKGVNDHDKAISLYKKHLKTLSYDRLYLNTPVRPPAEAHVEAPNHETLQKMASMLGGIAIDYLSSDQYISATPDDYEAIISLIRHHPMHQFEIKAFVDHRHGDYETLKKRLETDETIEKTDYMGFISYKIK